MNRTELKLYDPTAVETALRLLVGGAVTELRALEATSNGDRGPSTYSGYFDDPAALVSALATLRTARPGVRQPAHPHSGPASNRPCP